MDRGRKLEMDGNFNVRKCSLQMDENFNVRKCSLQAVNRLCVTVLYGL